MSETIDMFKGLEIGEVVTIPTKWHDVDRADTPSDITVTRLPDGVLYRQSWMGTSVPGIFVSFLEMAPQETMRVKAADLDPNDLIVITVDSVISDDTRVRITEHVSERMPDNKILILDKGMGMEVIRPKDVRIPGDVIVDDYDLGATNQATDTEEVPE